MKKSKLDSKAAESGLSEAWASFLPKLKSVKSFADTLALLKQQPDSNLPGRLYYSNLGWFIQFFTPPPGASIAELCEYLRIFRRIVGELSLPFSMETAVEGALIAAIDGSKPYEVLCA